MQLSDVDVRANRLDRWRDDFKEVLRHLAGKTLVVASAGNYGRDASLHVPSMLTTELAYVMAVGAADVIPAADFKVASSNFGEAVDLAAAGNYVIAAQTENPPKSSAENPRCGIPAELTWRCFTATSSAAPQVTSVAALMLALSGPSGPGIPPDVLKQRLKGTARGISSAWNYNRIPFRFGSMVHLDALKAVRTLLPVAQTQPVYVANQGFGAQNTPGEIIALEIDPMTGQRLTGAGPDSVIALSFTISGTAFNGRNPTSMAMAPQGDYLYVALSSTNASLGDGLLVINPFNHAAEDFIPLSGAAFPPDPVVPVPRLSGFQEREPAWLSRETDGCCTWQLERD